jgi:hypothetical protein
MFQREDDTIEHQADVEEVIRNVIDEEVGEVGEITPIVFLTQEEYDELDPPVSGTLYLIPVEPG